jgi:hypothetical protein
MFFAGVGHDVERLSDGQLSQQRVQLRRLVVDVVNSRLPKPSK